jgi:uncharacterized protein
MNRLWFALPFAAALALSPIARAQDASPSPQQIQTMIAAGQETQAVQALENVLESHPKSAVAWYLLAEAYDAQNNEQGAASALNMAVRSAPGLPFANPQEVAALRAHINASQPQAGGGGAKTAIFVIGGLIVLFLLLRLLPSRGQAMRQYGYPPPPPAGAPPYGFGYGPPSGGGGLGSALMGGLAAGAGFAAGERIIDGLTGQHGGPALDPNNFPQGPDPSRDDGLMGNPGWDNSSDDGLNNTGW